MSIGPSTRHSDPLTRFALMAPVSPFMACTPVVGNLTAFLQALHTTIVRVTKLAVYIADPPVPKQAICCASNILSHVVARLTSCALVGFERRIAGLDKSIYERSWRPGTSTLCQIGQRHRFQYQSSETQPCGIRYLPARAIAF